MNKSNKKLIIALSIVGIPVSINAHFFNKKVVATTGVTAGVALAALAYKKRQALKNAAIATKEKTVELYDRAVFAAGIKVLECQEWWQEFDKTPLNYADVTAATAFCGTAYGLKKLDDTYNVGRKIVNATKATARVTSGLIGTIAKATPGVVYRNSTEAWAYVNSHKTQVAVITGSLGAAYILWQIGKSVNADRQQNLTTIDAFLGSLSAEQFAAIGSSSDLVQLVGQAQDNPAYLLESADFVVLLSSKQKHNLEQIVAHYNQSIALLKADY